VDDDNDSNDADNYDQKKSQKNLVLGSNNMTDNSSSNGNSSSSSSSSDINKRNGANDSQDCAKHVQSTLELPGMVGVMKLNSKSSSFFN